jgi:ABC-2 type transport system permease protein
VATTAVESGHVASPGVLGLSFHQFHYDLLAFFRNRQSRFFTLALPVLFLVIFGSVFGGSDHSVRVSGGAIPTSAYYVPGIMTLGIIAAAFVNLVISVVAQRETGVLKRRRATPVPATALIAGRSLTSVVVALFTTAILLVLGWIFFRAHVPARSGLSLLVTVIVGTVSFGCMGYALASVIRNEDAAQPVTQAVMLPLYFISGVFVAVTTLPHWLVDIADVFPVRHLAAALLAAYNPHVTGAGFAGWDLLIVTAWGVAGLVIAQKRFSRLPLGR